MVLFFKFAFISGYNVNTVMKPHIIHSIKNFTFEVLQRAFLSTHEVPISMFTTVTLQFL
jgi:hypothetical protein